MNLLSYLIESLKSPGARPFLLAGLISAIGDSLYFVGISALVYKEFGPAAVAMMAIVRQVPGMLLTPLAGHFADILPRKTLVVIANAGSALIMGVMALLSFTELKSQLPYLVAVFFLVITTTVERTAKLALMPRLVEKDSLLALNTVINTINTVSLIVAPILGALLIQANALTLTFVLNGASFIISLLLMLTLPKILDSVAKVEEARVEKSNPLRTLFNNWSQGFVIILKDRDMRIVSILFFLNHLLIGVIFILIPFLADMVGQKDTGVGYLTSVLAYGAVVGTMVGAHYGKKSLKPVIMVGMLGLTVSVLLCGLTANVIVIYLLVTLIGFFSDLGDGPMWTMLQQITLDDKSGKVYAAVDAIILCGRSAGAILIGWLLTSATFQVATIVIAAMILIGTAYSSRGFFNSREKITVSE